MKPRLTRHGDGGAQPWTCYLCGAVGKGRHRDDCPWKPPRMRLKSPPAGDRARAPITEYLCANRHAFLSNLPHGKAICPFCRSTETVPLGTVPRLSSDTPPFKKRLKPHPDPDDPEKD